MLLFFRFLSIFFIVTVIFALFMLLSEVKLKISGLELIKSDAKYDLNYSGRIGIYFLGKVKFISVKINNNKIRKFAKVDYLKGKLEKLNPSSEYQKKFQRQIFYEIIKQLKEKTKIDKFKLQIILDTENVFLTSYLLGIISAVIPNVIRENIKKFNKDYYKIEISPLYRNHNFIYLKLDSIISIKVVHIINMFKVIGGKENERSSDRRLNVNCYGKY